MCKYSLFQKNVKSSKTEWLKIFYKVLYDLVPSKRFFGCDVKSKNPFPLVAGSDIGSATSNPSPILFDGQKDSRVVNHNKTYLKLEYFRQVLSERNLSDEEIKSALGIIYQSIPIIQASEKDGKSTRYEGYAKGTLRYNKKQAFRTMDFIKNHSGKGWESYFLTLTCDQKQYGSIKDAWTSYNKEEVKPVLENMRKHMKCEYVGVMESTKKGYPHIHLVLNFPRGTFPNLAKAENGHVIKQGRLYDMIKNSCKSPIFRLEVAKGDNLKYYLTKYISKDRTQDVFSIRLKKGELSDAERKSAMELIYTKCFKVRTLLICKDRSVAGNAERKAKARASVFGSSMQAKVVYKTLSSYERAKSDATKLRRFLTSLCINSPYYNPKNYHSLSANRYEKCFDRLPERGEVFEWDSTERFKHFGSILNINTGFFSDFCDFVLGDLDSRLNHRLVASDGKTARGHAYQKYDYENDEDFIKRLGLLCQLTLADLNLFSGRYLDTVEPEQII